MLKKLILSIGIPLLLVLLPIRSNAQIVISPPPSSIAITCPTCITGTLGSTQIVYGTGAQTVSSEAAFTYDASTNAFAVDTVNTGQGANELYDMDQNVLTTSNVVFNLVSFLSGDGLSFAGANDPITIVGGADANDPGSTALVFNNPLDGYLVFSFPIGVDTYIGAPSFWYFGAGSFGFSSTAGILTGFSSTQKVDFRTSLNASGDITDAVIVLDTTITQDGGGNVVTMYVDRAVALNSGTGTTTTAVGQYAIARNDAAGTITNAWPTYSYIENLGVGTITNGSAFHARNPTNSGGGTLTNYYTLWQNNIQGNNVTNGYYLWYDGGVGSNCDSGGVYRVNDFGISAYYNPCFAKYAPGAANFERIISRWGDTGVFGLDNRAIIGVEEGGTGVERPLDLNAGNVSIKSLTLSPAVTNTSANSCGTTAATIAGNDNVFKVTVGATAGTSCTITFATAFINAPSCVVSNETTANLLRATSTTSTAIIAGTMVAGDVLAGICVGR